MASTRDPTGVRWTVEQTSGCLNAHWKWVPSTDAPNPREPIGAPKSVGEIRGCPGADSLGCLSGDGLMAAEREPRRFRRACFTGQYPVAADPTASKLALERMERGPAARA